MHECLRQHKLLNVGTPRGKESEEGSGQGPGPLDGAGPKPPAKPGLITGEEGLRFHRVDLPYVGSAIITSGASRRWIAIAAP